MELAVASVSCHHLGGSGSASGEHELGQTCALWWAATQAQTCIRWSRLEHELGSQVGMA